MESSTRPKIVRNGWGNLCIVKHLKHLDLSKIIIIYKELPVRFSKLNDTYSADVNPY